MKPNLLTNEYGQGQLGQARSELSAFSPFISSLTASSLPLLFSRACLVAPQQGVLSPRVTSYSYDKLPSS
ncbi:hypothetical protein HZ326_0043 [Fusarium oxysporum f. sp. albedinis]|nr:hypothetical protein HZ326_0043 [Fusarium oxysporum f. sp. albedinis]